MNAPQQPEPLDFDAIEHELNLANLREMATEVPQRSERLAKRIAHFSAQFDIPEDDFWLWLDIDPTGPLGAVLAREARRQNVHENAAVEYLKRLENVEGFQKLPSIGNNARYINSSGQVVTKLQLGGSRPPSKSLDFRWRTGTVTCYAAQKYTKEVGGNQDNQFNEVERLLQDYQKRTANDTALFVLVDGPYYTKQKLDQLRSLTRNQSPYSYVSSINALQPILNRIANGYG